MASEEDLAEMTARRCQYECKTMNDDEYKRIKVIIATAITAARAETWKEAIAVASGVSDTDYDFRGHVPKPVYAFKQDTIRALEAAAGSSEADDQNKVSSGG